MIFSEIEQQLSMSEDDLRVLTFIAQNGKSTALQISNFVKVERGKVYRCVEKLINLGIIKTTMENPKKYTIVEMGEIESILRTRLEQSEKLQKAGIEKLMETLNKFSNTRQEKWVSPRELTIINTSSVIWNHLENCMKKAKSSITFMVNKTDLARMQHSGIIESLEKSKVLATLITDTNPIQGMGKVKIIQVPGSLPGKVLIVDDEWLYFSGRTSNTIHDKDDMVIKTNDLGLIEQYKKLMELIIESKPQK